MRFNLFVESYTSINNPRYTSVSKRSALLFKYKTINVKLEE